MHPFDLIIHLINDGATSGVLAEVALNLLSQWFLPAGLHAD